jgi:hypothetical protein
MSDVFEAPETPTLVVRIYRDGQPTLSELCDSEAEAALVVESWSEIEGARCEVHDLGMPTHHDDDAELLAGPGDEYRDVPAADWTSARGAR